MDEREELKQELQQELLLVQYRMKMLDIMEGKLLQMEQLTEVAKQGNLTDMEIEALNSKINDLASQVKAIDSESRKKEDEKIL